ncbi:MAG: 2-dehydropantoate 2-reductase [Acidobacteriota bacterium]|nr:2-dehydropantoate 2-reductase [Acidobacteriota bacterium]
MGIDFERIAVIGAGPVGSLAAAYLARSGRSILLSDSRSDRIETVRERGVRVEGKADHFTRRLAAADVSKAGLPAFRPNAVFLCVKSFSLPGLLDDLAGLFGPETVILVMQNGLDNEDAVAERFGADRVLRAVVHFAGALLEPGVVRMMFFNPPNYIGALTPAGAPAAERLAAVFTEAGLAAAAVPDIKRHEWIKAILSAALMPVCGPTGMTMKEALALSETRTLCERILQESISVAASRGFVFGESFFSDCLDYLMKADNHKPSSSVDLEAGLPVEYVFQPIIDAGHASRTPTPCLEALTLVMRALEKRRDRTGKLGPHI